ncbi:hypothetical protein ISCGN_010411 [Ixodes scapularis]
MAFFGISLRKRHVDPGLFRHLSATRIPWSCKKKIIKAYRDATSARVLELNRASVRLWTILFGEGYRNYQRFRLWDTGRRQHFERNWNRDARGSDSFREPVPPRGTVPKKQSPLSARRWGEGAGLPGQRSGGGGCCVQAGEAIAIFFLLVCGSGYPTSLDVWSGPISSRKVNHSSAQAAFSTARAPLCSAHSRRWWPVSAYSLQSLAVGVSVPPHVVPAHRDYGTVGVETVDGGRCPDLFLAPLRPSDFRPASEKYAEDSGAMSSWTKP